MLTDERMRELFVECGWLANSDEITTCDWALARAVEREARREALEEAARVCSNAGVMDCAAAIRALIDKEQRT